MQVDLLDVIFGSLTERLAEQAWTWRMADGNGVCVDGRVAADVAHAGGLQREADDELTEARGSACGSGASTGSARAPAGSWNGIPRAAQFP